MQLSDLARRSTLRGAVLFVALAAAASAQNQTWIRQFGSEGYEFATGAVPDGAGGVYLGGYGGTLGGVSAGADDAWLVRLDGAGNQVWVRQFGTSVNDYSAAAATDGMGGAFISGETYGDLGGPNAGELDAWLVRYDSAGNQTWARQIGTSGADGSSAVASDEAGGAYVCGTTAGSLGGPNAGERDAWLARFDGSGNQMWIRQVGSGGDDDALAAAPDGAGGVFVGGYTSGNLGGPNAGVRDAWLAHYDNTGSQSWIRQIGSSFADRVQAATSDGAGGVFVSGYTKGDLGGPSVGMDDAWLAHYDGSGNQTWLRQLGSAAVDRALAVAADGSGGVYLSGETDGSLGGPPVGVRDGWFARYDGTGNQVWIRQLGTRRWDVAWAAAPDASGGVYVSGSTGGSLVGPNAGGADVWLARYDGGLTAIRYCTPGIPNSTGQAGKMNAAGSNALAAIDVTLEASQLPQSSFGYFLTSRTRGLVIGAGGSQGAFCLGGSIGRYVGPGQIGSSGATGSFSLAVDLTTMPTPTGFVAALPGETWHFQAWHRDANPTATSNFTDAVSVVFR